MAAVKTSGFRAAWLGAITVLLMDGGDTPPSGDRLVTLAARRVGPTAKNDGYVTARNNGGDPNDYQAGWQIIVDEIVALLRDHGFIGENGSLRWTGPTSGKVTWGGKKYTIHSADDRQQSRDYNRVMLGSHADHGVVDVVGARGGITKKRLEVHPLAHLLPQIPRAELAELRKDIEENGVLVPLLMFEDKVLDGRHRHYLAATLGRPVRLETFEGTEAEARARIGSLNLLRRHLTAGQRTQLAVDLYMEAAKEEAAEAKAEGQKRGGSERMLDRKPAVKHPRKTAAQIVAKKSGGATSARAVEAIQVAQDDPEVVEQLRAGTISVTGAEKKARERKGTKAPPKVDAWKTTINGELGRMLGHLTTIREGLDLDAGADPATLRGRIEELRTGLLEVLSELEQRSAI